MSNEIKNATAEPYAGFNEDQRKREELKTRIERAQAAILPGALREAFAGEPAQAGGYQLQPVTLGLTASLERIKSPLLEVIRIMRETFSRDSGAEISTDERLARIKEKVGTLKFEEEQIAETIFIFMRPPGRVRKLLDSGRDKFRETAMEELGDKLHPTQMAALQRACAQHYVQSFATIIGYGTPPSEGDGLVFPPPSPGAVTGSVGG